MRSSLNSGGTYTRGLLVLTGPKVPANWTCRKNPADAGPISPIRSSGRRPDRRRPHLVADAGLERGKILLEPADQLASPSGHRPPCPPTTRAGPAPRPARPARAREWRDRRTAPCGTACAPAIRPARRAAARACGGCSCAGRRRTGRRSSRCSPASSPPHAARSGPPASARTPPAAAAGTARRSRC